MTKEDWENIDEGWEDVELQKTKRKRHRSKKRGQKRSTSEQPLKQSVKKKEKTKKHIPKSGTTNKESKIKEAKAKLPSWMLPAFGFIGAVILIALAIMATK